MSAIAETAGPFSRCKLMANAFKLSGIEVATCIAEDVNYKEIEGIKNYFLDIPMPFGLPKFIASRTFPVAQKLGITSKKTVNSFDQVLLFTGNLDYNYLKKCVESICKTIQDFNPDIVYSEFNISAFIAAKIKNKRIFATVSYPSQHDYANNPKLSEGLNKLLKELDLPQVESALKLFDWAEKCFCPSIKELEPLKKENVIFCGALKNKIKKETEENLSISIENNNNNNNKILVYMGNGTISASKMEKEIKNAFIQSKYDIYIASQYLTEKTEGNIHIAKRWDFNKLLNEAILFINHGGQNSVIDGLLHGVPQIIVPGKVFERCYNAKSVVDNNAGVIISHNDFKASNIFKEAETIINSKTIKENAIKLGKMLESQGGIDIIINNIKCN
ncbi:UDP-Glycosyltransferase/glycogen phosphorylase [Anaeromyces robustus]|uniref:UDP-Glycosyltransferase/glycogen phosphorylase n=1 Tax=Anaeromyces robustus TaxID=1754192 RepID=A0A1Y1V7X2_9FUNG|nr:UDP-Glycosyltransferase/glycogen phosphorylase [Anaeromyces robustus]|eukprot:ORX49558.1 UDP-Glycosyltransferase/glycogen phosphorylase [Anaeromyces robustus]